MANSSHTHFCSTMYASNGNNRAFLHSLNHVPHAFSRVPRAASEAKLPNIASKNRLAPPGAKIVKATHRPDPKPDTCNPQSAIRNPKSKPAIKLTNSNRIGHKQ